MEQTAGATQRQGSDRRTWLLGAIAVIVLIAIAAATVMLASTREDATYEPGSPEAAVQAYAAAWQAGDADAAWDLLTPGAQARVQEFEFRRAASWEEDMPTRLWVDERHDYEGRVVLDLSLERTWDGLLGPDRDIQSLRLTLIQIDDAWRIDTPVVGFYPW